MCNACVIQSVKEKMLSRRSLFRATAVTAAAAALAPAALARSPEAAVPAATAATPFAVTDLTHELHEDFPNFFGDQQLFREQKLNFAEHRINLFEVRYNEHIGTHIDAPLHFSADGASVAEIPVENLVAPLVVVDIREKAAADVDAQLTPDDIKGWVERHGDLPERAVVALNSGWQAHLGSDRFRGADSDGKLHFPGFHPEAAHYLLENSNAVGIAVDTLSLDHGPSGDFGTHYGWLGAGRWGLEGIANLDALPARGATLVVGAPKLRGGTGGPSRVFALV